ncbi:MAG: vibriobactin utilization protein ViuB [Gammaproteobacteria bacterium]|nr:MAG: vibriobactin utilization protein ViuB [Gammaproteobacteria bacterium]
MSSPELRPAPPAGPRWIELVEREPLGPRLVRLWFRGAALDAAAVWPGAHIKLFFPRPGRPRFELPRREATGVVWPAPERRPVARSYSLRAHDPVRDLIAVEMVLHQPAGPASAWAAAARPGARIGLAGPGGPRPLLAPAPAHLLAGDLSALPAIAAVLEALPAGVEARVFLEIETDAERIALPSAAAVDCRWLCRRPGDASPLPEAVAAAGPPGPRFSALVAGENAAVLALRRLLRVEWGLPKALCYAVPYWRIGADEERYHDERHAVMDSEP